MYDMAHENAAPGRCGKCNGSGIYAWGTVTNGKPAFSGSCHSCGGTGQQTARDIGRNRTYNRYKVARIAAG